MDGNSLTKTKCRSFGYLAKLPSDQFRQVLEAPMYTAIALCFIEPQEVVVMWILVDSWWALRRLSRSRVYFCGSTTRTSIRCACRYRFSSSSCCWHLWSWVLSSRPSTCGMLMDCSSLRIEIGGDEAGGTTFMGLLERPTSRSSSLVFRCALHLEALAWRLGRLTTCFWPIWIPWRLSSSLSS